MAPGSLRCGVVVASGTCRRPPTGAAAGADDPVLAAAAAAERHGYDAFAVAAAPGGGRGEVARDPFVLLGAAAQLTGELQLGALLAAGDRPPAMVAKSVASLDVVSAGRAFQLLEPLPRRARRSDEGRRRPTEAAELAEEIEVCRAMLRVPAASYAGAWHRIQTAWNQPLAARPTPTPVGLVVPLTGEGRDAAGGEGGQESLAALLGVAGRASDLTVLDLGTPPAGEVAATLERLAVALQGLAAAGRALTPPRCLAMIGPVPPEPTRALAALVEGALWRCEGVLLAWPRPSGAAGSGGLAAWRRLIGAAGPPAP